MLNRCFIPVVILFLVLQSAGCSPAAPSSVGADTPSIFSMPSNTASVERPVVTAAPSSTMEVPSPEKILSIVPVPLAAGDSHTCMVTAAGAVRCWGSNQFGQLGNATTGMTSLPVETEPIPEGAAALAAGKDHTCALNAGGAVYCWGANAHGQLGDGTSTDRSVPAPVQALTEKMVMLVAGDSFSCALSVSGEVKCWGWNTEGQLGDGSQLDRYFPVDVDGLSDGVISIAAGSKHACALLGSGGVRCWGRGYESQLGDGLRKASALPVQVTGLQSGVDAIAAGGTYSCATLHSEKVMCWGYLVLVGDEDDFGVPQGSRMIQKKPASIGMGAYFACVLTAEGGVECWGTNQSGQLGNGNALDQFQKPDPVVGLSEGATYLAVGSRHACALLRSGEVRCWGANEAWQLGNKSVPTAHSPFMVDLATVHYYFSGIEAAAPPAEYPQKYPSLWGLTEEFRDLIAPGVNTYAATVKRSGIWGWDFYLCATDETWLERMLGRVTVAFTIDNQTVSEKAMLIFRSNYNSWSCQGWTSSLSQWEHDEYQLGIVYEFKENTSDGERSYAAGKYWQIVMLKVED
jgi:alpha-tubulin suppressor-like RCC1 family protein